MSDAQYAWKMRAQLWRDDPYYVASSRPMNHIEVVASTKQEAMREAVRILGEAPRYLVWKFWFDGARDIRIPKEE